MLEERRTPPLSRDPAFILAVIYTIGFFVVVGFIFFVVVPQANEDIIKQIMPILSAIQLGIVQYFYNKSNQQSRERTDQTVEKVASAVVTLADTAKTTATTAATVADTASKTADTAAVTADTAAKVATSSTNGKNGSH